MGNITGASDQNLKNAADYDEYRKINQANMLYQNLSEYLKEMLHQKKLRRSDVIRNSGLEKSYVYQIFGGKKRPTRDKLIALAFGLHLNAEETQRMLKLGGWSELYSRVERDALILKSIYQGKSISDTDDSLYERGFDTLL